MITLKTLDPNPSNELLKWYQDAIHAQIKNPDAMTLATATVDGTPSARIVLFKGLNTQGIRFFTNYQSRKGHELQTNPQAALVFYWSALDRQVRIEGQVEPLSAAESDQYWLSRPRESRLSALASPQSTPIPSRDVLEEKITHLTKQFQDQEIPRPAHWGGFCLIPQRFEFWVAGDYRFHDRFCYQRKSGNWEISQLAP